MQIDVGGFNRFVTEPQGDHRPVDAVLEEFHRGGVAKRMRSNSLLFQRRASGLSSGEMFGQQIAQSVVTQWSTTLVGEEGISGFAATFFQPCA